MAQNTSFIFSTARMIVQNFRFISSPERNLYISWYLKLMVTPNMLRMCAGKWFFSGEKNTGSRCIQMPQRDQITEIAAYVRTSTEFNHLI